MEEIDKVRKGWRREISICIKTKTANLLKKSMQKQAHYLG